MYIFIYIIYINIYYILICNEMLLYSYSSIDSHLSNIKCTLLLISSKFIHLFIIGLFTLF